MHFGIHHIGRAFSHGMHSIGHAAHSVYKVGKSAYTAAGGAQGIADKYETGKALLDRGGEMTGRGKIGSNLEEQAGGYAKSATSKHVSRVKTMVDQHQGKIKALTNIAGHLGRGNEANKVTNYAGRVHSFFNQPTPKNTSGGAYIPSTAGHAHGAPTSMYHSTAEPGMKTPPLPTTSISVRRG